MTRHWQSPRVIAVSLILLVGIIGSLIVWWQSEDTPSKIESPSATGLVSPAVPPSQPNLPSPTEPPLTPLDSRTITNVDPAFQFTATMPAGWQTAAVPAIQAITLFDPAASDAAEIDKSQIFIRYFRATTFLTLSTVTIFDRAELTLNGRPAIRYDIEKKASVANFPSQPAWRNTRHFVTDVRVSDTSPSIFYVIARRPDLDEDVYNQFLASLSVDGSASTVGLLEPVMEFNERITKKPFGIFITPETSPIQPERFSGYHTAVDVEYGDVMDDVPVRAIAAGEVVQAGIVSGYGGLLVARHTINGAPHIVIYGHLDPKSLLPTGTTVSASDQLGILGDGGTSETDGERKHLHFGIRADNTVNIRGYVATEAELSGWLNPLDFYTK